MRLLLDNIVFAKDVRTTLTFKPENTEKPKSVSTINHSRNAPPDDNV